MTQFFYTPEQIDALLVSRMEALARALAPDGTRRGREWVALNPARADGRKGSFSINLNNGVWKDFASGDGAKSMPGLSLVTYLATAGDFKRAIGWAKDWLGLSNTAPDPAIAKRIAERTERNRAEEESRREAMLRAAFALYLDGRPLDGDDPASKYLKARGIDPLLLEGARFPRSLRFHGGIRYPHIPGKFPALIACQSLEGQMLKERARGFAGIHRIYLKETGGLWGKAFGKDSKVTLGYRRGASIRIARGLSKKSLREAPAGEWVNVTEGVEDGLALALALPGQRVLAAYSLDAIGKLILPPQIGGVVIVADNDTGNQAAEDALESAALALCDRHAVKIARMPDIYKDVNDALLDNRRPS